MKKNWKKVLSMILAASLVFSLSTAAFAAEVEEEIKEVVEAVDEVAGAVEVEAEVGDEVVPVGGDEGSTSLNRVLSFNLANTDDPIGLSFDSVAELTAAGTFDVKVKVSDNEFTTLKSLSDNVSFNATGEVILEFPTVSGAKFTFPVIKAVISDNEYEVTEWDGKKPGADGEVVSGNNTYKATWKKVEKTPEEPELTEEEKIKELLSDDKVIKLEGATYTFEISANKALQYTGTKHEYVGGKSKPGKNTLDIDVKIGYIKTAELKANPSANFTAYTGSDLKVTVKNNVNATVSPDGTAVPYLTVAKACQITKIDAKGLPKDVRKDLKDALKKEVAKVKANKKASATVSDGKVMAGSTELQLLIAVYPVLLSDNGVGKANYFDGKEVKAYDVKAAASKTGKVKMKDNAMKSAKAIFEVAAGGKKPTKYTAKNDKAGKKTNGIAVKSTDKQLILNGNLCGSVKITCDAKGNITAVGK